LSDEVIMRAIDGLVIKKIIIVPNRIINIVAS
jgi:leucyl-tRNA synthetase